MPRNVRNFWIDASIDGRPSKLSGGPRSKDGGFDITIYQRHDGRVVDVLDVRGYVDPTTNLLTLRVFPPNGGDVLDVDTRDGIRITTRR